MGTPDVLADGPLAFYLLNDLGGSVAVDSSGNGRDGTHVNDPIRLDCATSYDGVSDDSTLGNPALALSASAGTWESWLWMNSYNWYSVLRDDSGLPSGDNGWLLYADTSTDIALSFASYRVGGTAFTTDVPAAEVKDQTWRHFAITYDATETRYFVDGALRWTGGGPASAPSPGPGASAVALPWHVAKNGELPDHFTMRAARVAFFGSKLADARIAAHASGAPPCSVGGPTTGYIGPGAFFG